MGKMPKGLLLGLCLIETCFFSGAVFGEGVETAEPKVQTTGILAAPATPDKGLLMSTFDRSGS